MKNVIALGETTYDIVFKNDIPIEAKVGGSVLNTSVSLGRLGVPVSLIAACGSDEIGVLTQKFLSQNNINTSLLSIYNGTSRIALAFLDQNNNARYSFYNGLNTNNSEILFPTDISDGLVLFGSSFAIKAEIRSPLLSFLELAKAKSSLIYYDPNIRSSHLATNLKAKDWILENFRFANIIKGSDEDFKLLFNTSSACDSYNAIREINQKAILLVTANKSGVDLFTPSFHCHYEVPQIVPISTIGAGDTFSAGIIYGLYKLGASTSNILSLSEIEWKRTVGYAIKFATEVCLSYENYVNVNIIAD